MHLDSHAHACGVYVHEKLLRGVIAQDVVSSLLHAYPVVAIYQRVLAYIRYREEHGDHWLANKIDQIRWEVVYGMVSANIQYKRSQ